ncbi:TonB-dependent receptor [Agaribacter marinus]|uniref:TonB-dependent receptor n=1 Tax=Agaribacter marinus TaxID=1431249 RepID=A0AA37SZK3_9ALTE|nr:TonB-dependent receptor [Agaribacter marinus]
MMQHNNINKKIFTYSALTLAISASFMPVLASAQDDQAEEQGVEQIVVTGTRRVNDVQDIPVNIMALSATQLERDRVYDLVDVSKWVPGLTVVDQGGRSSNTIIVRGLNTDSLGPSGTNTGGGTVATYLGEIPLYLDLKLTDMERVEVLIGPQGTLYGAGTLGGAIRYIPKKAEMDVTSAQVYGDIYSMSESDSNGNTFGAIVNIPIIDDSLALRASFQHYDDPGFIDYAYVVKEIGVSNPQPSNEAFDDNLIRVNDANGETTDSARISLRWTPADEFEANFTYYYQDQEIEGRSLVHQESFNTGPYESGLRVLEPNNLKNELFSLELVFDLGFAELVSATGISNYDELGQRDQTDLLLDFEYGYESFPSFTAFTREIEEQETITQEIRLVSTSDGPLSWIVGYFDNEFDRFGTSEEFTPGIPAFFGVERPDNLEYFSVLDENIKETAFFGEVGYEVTEDLTVTLGARFYEYETEVTQGFDLPLLDTLGGAPSDRIEPNLQENEASDDGSLFKLNIGYDMTDDALVYFTASEGYRIGGVNSVAPCTPDDINTPGQALCALPDEVLILPDETKNYELGIHSTWLNNNLVVNGSLFHIDWTDIQISDVTENGGLPITINGSEASSQGVELSWRALLGGGFSTQGSFAYTKAELGADAAEFVDGDDAFDGDRLPGSPERSLSMGLTYNTEVFNGMPLLINYGVSYTGDIYTRVGLRDFGEVLPSYTLHNMSVTLTGESWDVTLYAKNLFDKYAVTSTRAGREDIRAVNGFDIRSYGRFINQPRTVGVEFTYNFGD